MQNLAIHQLLFVCLQIVSNQGLLMFPPDPFYVTQPCIDNDNCVTGCCLLIQDNGVEKLGLCQSMGQFGHYCAPGERLRTFRGSKMYTYSCPCLPGLECKPLWVREVHGMRIMQDPKCTPKGMSPRSRLISRFLYNEFPPVPVQ